MLARWLTRLQEYDFTTEFRPGKQHLNADGLSRCHSCKNPKCPGFLGLPPPAPKKVRGEQWKLESSTPCIRLDNEFTHIMCADVRNTNDANTVNSIDDKLKNLQWLNDFSQLDIAAAQEKDKNLSKVIMWKKNGIKPTTEQLAPCSEEVKALVSRWSALSLTRDNVLIRTCHPARSAVPVKQIVLPYALRSVVLHQLHDLRVSGHLGINRTIARVAERFYWPGSSTDVARWCAACPICSLSLIHISEPTRPY